ncbi:uncharacterized protein LOC129751065 [Uranotaenia lowii]|uniref:uncharacterized protein LOC129751065 n=1 Tax=Uranotaenia lowii TaxID=190385 RepID=UPI00247AB80E|nr:uncharacterized protein LOC129751065 [Uranotaenia lowii]
MADNNNIVQDLPQALQDLLNRVALSQGFKPSGYSIQLESGSTVGDGFVGRMIRANIKESGTDRSLKAMCKVMQSNQEARDRYNSPLLFSKECDYYASLLPTMCRFQEEKQVPVEARFSAFPECYLSVYDEQSKEYMIALEDLRQRRFEMWDKLVPMSYENVKLVMEQLGRFHAVSLALKDQRPEVFEQFKAHRDELTRITGIKEFLDSMVKKSIDTLGTHEQDARERMQKLYENFWERINACLDPKAAEPYTVLCHGDIWANNMMFRYEEKSPQEVVFLDLQAIRNTSPVNDVVHFLFCATDDDFRQLHYKEMLQTYYNSLSNLLRLLGGDPERQFPQSAFQQQLKKFGIIGLLIAAFALPPTCTDYAKASNESMDDNSFLEFSTQERDEARYRKRMSGAIRDAIRFGYL